MTKCPLHGGVRYWESSLREVPLYSNGELSSFATSSPHHQYALKVSLIYINHPYNTGAATYTHTLSCVWNYPAHFSEVSYSGPSSSSLLFLSCSLSWLHPQQTPSCSEFPVHPACGCFSPSHQRCSLGCSLKRSTSLAGQTFHRTILKGRCKGAGRKAGAERGEGKVW